MTLSIQLGVLESSNLIQLAAIQPELEYLFRHVLVKDAAYHSLVKSDRRALHQVVGETLERLYLRSPTQGQTGQVYPLLAYHFASAGDVARTQRYYTLAGEAAAAAYANREAAAHFALALAAATENGAPASELARLHTRLGRVRELTGDYADALEGYAQMEALGQARGDTRLVLEAVLLQAVVRGVPSAALNPVLADQLTTRALSLARELNDPAYEARALWARMLYALLVGNSLEAVQSGEEALKLARGLHLPEQLALILVDLGRAYGGAGMIPRSRAAHQEALALWRALGNQPMVAETLNDSAAIEYFTGNFADAMAALEEALAISQATANAWGQAYTLMIRAFVFLEQGAVQAALETIEACLALAVAGGFLAPSVEVRSGRGLLLANLGQFEQAKAEVQAASNILAGQTSPVLTALLAISANVYLLAGELETAEAVLAEVRRQPEYTDLTAMEPMFEALADAGLGLAKGDFARAAGAPSALLAREREMGFHAFEVDLQLVRARGLMGLGRLEEAGALLDEAAAGAEARGIQRLQWEVCAAQAELAERQGEGEAAVRLRQQARAGLLRLAGTIDDPTLRAGLLARPTAYALLGGQPAET